MTSREHRESLCVQRHVVDHGAVNVEDDGLRLRPHRVEHKLLRHVDRRGLDGGFPHLDVDLG